MSRVPIEILAPAGDMDMVRAAVFSGADCVYLGFEGFNARRPAKNFTTDTLTEAIEFCHARGVGVYIALNTVVKQKELPHIQKAIESIQVLQGDAIIVQDLATAQYVKEIAPHIPLHASTQMSVHSIYGVKQLENFGFSRAILARELSFEEIEAIAKQSTIELEVFVHGALCVCVSGQCYMSTLLGGRSANRGNCAGSCRLPFKNFSTLNTDASIAKEGDNGLSLKDLSVLKDLPKLEKIGIKSAKIEGRLRGPEYCAAVVDAALKARDTHLYDEQLLSDVFSRKGFTNAWFYPDSKYNMFGVRTQSDHQTSKKVIPQLRALYRRERPRIGVQMTLKIQDNTLSLTVDDGKNRVKKTEQSTFNLSKNNQCELLEKALSKTGGTPFHTTQINIDIADFYVSTAQVNALKKQALQALLTIRAQEPINIWLNPQANKTLIQPLNLPDELLSKYKHGVLQAQFQTVHQIPDNIFDFCESIIVPIEVYEKIPKEWYSKTILSLPRVHFGKQEQKVKNLVEQARNVGLQHFYIQNLAHLALCKGVKMEAGFGMNITNTYSAQVLNSQGCSIITLSPELATTEVTTITKILHEQNIRTDALVYGHLPMMVSRACEIKSRIGCQKCQQKPGLVDRKGEQLPVLCTDGIRHIFNAVPLWMGDRLAEITADFFTLYFTIESKEKVRQVLNDFKQGNPCTGKFTRGLYAKGID